LQLSALASIHFFLGADDRNRTGDLRITNALLYQLSYIGVSHALDFSIDRLQYSL
jgi:hypothetical protein